MEMVFVKSIDCCFVRSNVSGLRQINSGREKADGGDFSLRDGDRRVPSIGLLGL